MLTGGFMVAGVLTTGESYMTENHILHISFLLLHSLALALLSLFSLCKS